MADKHTVFVYGSLKRGYGNHVLLEDSKLIAVDSIKGFEMYSLGGFPAIVPVDGRNLVHGEVYEVDDNTMRQLDILEGYPDFYNRTTAWTVAGGHYCWVYYQKEPPNDSLVEGGHW